MVIAVLEKNISEATVIYENADFSVSECSKEDVNKIKNFMILYSLKVTIILDVNTI